MLGDFRSCQILWALRLLGGVGEAPIEMAVDTAIGIFDAPPVAAPKPEPIEAPAPETETSEVAMAPEPDPQPLPISEADASAEVISEPWRLAALRPTDEPNAPEPEPVRLELDTPGGAPARRGRAASSNADVGSVPSSAANKAIVSSTCLDAAACEPAATRLLTSTT